ncbi:MaoC/PaaZ C-terminal domain-containing protein [Pseudooceanicola sp. 502str34]
MSHEQKFFEDFEVGDSYVTAGRTITETDIVMHAMHSGDFMPHHTDAEFAATQQIKQRIAHGNLTFVISTGLIFQSQGMNANVMNYGYGKIRYPGVVHIGDTIKTEVTVAEKKDAKQPTHGVLTQTETTTNQRGETVCFVEHLLYVRKKSA